jgi:hypothetical protein
LRLYVSDYRSENVDMTENDCVFCDLAQFRAADVCIENVSCLYAATRDPRDPPDVLPGCGVIIPIAHRPSPFDFTAEEWAATHEFLLQAKTAQDERLAPTATRSFGIVSRSRGNLRITPTCT